MAAASEDERGWTPSLPGKTHLQEQRASSVLPGTGPRSEALLQDTSRCLRLPVGSALGRPHSSSLDEQGTGMGNRMDHGSAGTGDRPEKEGLTSQTCKDGGWN